jgi:hypothetical protein
MAMSFEPAGYHHGYQETAPQESPSHDPTPGQPAAQDEQVAEFFRVGDFLMQRLFVGNLLER